MSNQLIKTTEQGKENVFPRTRIQDLFDDTSGQKLIDILKSFNMMFVSYLGNKPYTRNQISPELRRQGLWLTYVIDNTVYTEWYDKVTIDDTNWGSDSNWRQGSNALVGDLSVSPNGTWVINGEDSGITIKGDKGDSPVIRIYDNKIQVSYDKGVTYQDLNNTPVYTKFRFNSQTNTYQVSYDLGANWQDISDEKVYHKFRYNQATNTYQESSDFGKTWSNISAEKVYTKFRFNRSTNTYQASTDLGQNWTDVSSDKVYYQFRYNGETNTHQVSTDFGATWTNVSEDKVFYQFRTNDNRLQVSTDLGTTWENCSEPIAAWFRWASGDTADSVGKIQISRDQQNWEDLSPIMTNNLYIKGYIATVGELPTSSAAIGDIYMVGPTYDESDTTHDYPHYRMWVKQSSGWVDNGEYQSNVQISQTTGQETGITMSQKAITDVIGSYIENPEFIHVHRDSEGKLLWWIEKDGTVGWSKGIPTPIQEELKKLEQLIKDNTEGDESIVARVTANEENIVAINDALDKKVDGEYIENPEFIHVLTDSEGRVLWGILNNGKVMYGAGIPDQIAVLIEEIYDTFGRISENFSEIEDIEDRVSINMDKEHKIIAFRDKEGVLHENAGIETKNLNAQNAEIESINTKGINAESLNLSKVGLTEFEEALKKNGFTGGQGDWSTASTLHIPIPRCAIMNITSADGNPYSWPTRKFVNNKVWVEFYDMQGNYFKKRAIHNAQGNSSMAFIKKNGAFDFCNDEWIGDDVFSIKFGDWVYQDSFHVKAYYTDFFKGSSVVAYKIADQVEKSRGIFKDRPWKALLKDYVFGSDQANSAQINDMTLQLNNEAKCHPDGFPCIIYLDGEFYGIYAFCLKKHRDNYHMKKDVAEHIHLDGDLYVNTLWLGNIDWTAFEIRNPKNLYYKEAQNGTFEYDADVAQAEIAGDDEVNAWIAAGQLPDGTKITSKIKKRLQMTAKVKNYITNLSKAVNQIKSATTTEEKKSRFETYFDVDNLVDYEIVQMATGDNDGFGKNWQWTTYDGVKWWVNEYDKDASFGGHATGTFTQPAPNSGGWMGNDSNQPIGQLISLYQTEIISRWKYMVDKGIFSSDNFLSLFNEWIDQIGTDNFEKEYEKWPEAPCNRDDKVDTTHWKRTNTYTWSISDVNYDNSKTYQVGEKCYFGFDVIAFEFECIAESTGNPPLTQAYNNYPKTLGYRDSLWRLVNYIKQRLEKENEFINNL